MSKEILTRLEEIQASIRKLQETASKPLDLTEAADHLHISKSHLYQLTSKSIIPHYKPNGKKIFFDKVDLDGYLRQHRISSITEIEAAADRRISEMGAR